MQTIPDKQAKRRILMVDNSALLAAAGGFLDAFTYLGHGHVFANAMTGNVVLLGISCISGSWRTGLRHLPPIFCFVLGVSAAKLLRTRPVQRLVRHTGIAALAVEICILVTLSLLPASTRDIWFTTAIAFAASVQVGTFREVNGRNYNSTFTTGNLRTLSEAAFDWLVEGHSPGTARVVRDFALICIAFFLGATTGGYATGILGNRALWIELGVLILVAFRIWPKKEALVEKSAVEGAPATL